MSYQTCTKCFANKSVTEFNWRNKTQQRRHSFCKACHTAYRKAHYLSNKNKYITKARAWNTKQTKILREYIVSYLERHPCIDCGENDIRVLDFDHTEHKYMGICQMIRNCYSLDKVQEEIAKCEIRCANCHRKKTFSQGKYWRDHMGA